MKFLASFLVVLSILELTPCIQTCFVDLFRRLTAPRRPSDNLPLEHRQTPIRSIQNAIQSFQNTLTGRDRVELLRNGVEVLAEEITTKTPEFTTTPWVTTTSVVTATPAVTTVENHHDQNVLKLHQNLEAKISNIITVSDSVSEEVFTENPSVQDLLDSFGGAKADETPGERQTPNNGLYFLFDWNSFLEVDDQEGRRVNLRVQPKIGNPKNFLDVRVP